MSEEIPKCKVTLKRGKDRAWSLEVNDASPECLASLKNISGKMGRQSKKYLAKRIETRNPEVAKVLQDLDLSK